MPAAQKIKFSIKDFLLKESLIGNFIFCAFRCWCWDADAKIYKWSYRLSNSLENVTKLDNLSTIGDSYYNYHIYLKIETEQNHAFDSFFSNINRPRQTATLNFEMLASIT